VSDLDESETTKKSSIDEYCYMSVKVNKAVEVLPLSLCRLAVKSNSDLNCDVFLKGTNVFVNKHKLAVGNCIVKMNNGIGIIYVLNPFRHCVKINRGERIGSIQKFCDNDIVLQLPETDLRNPMNNRGVEPIVHSSSMERTEEVFDPDIATMEFGTHLSKNEKRSIHILLSKYRDCFAFSPNELGCHPSVEMKIDLKDSTPVRKGPNRVSHFERQEINAQVKDYLKRGIIVESISPYSSPVVLQKKKDGSFRFCVDYRKLNELTHVDHYPLPRMDDIFDRMSGAKYISTLDLLQGYHQIRMEKNSQSKTAFVTTDGKYEFIRMPFGLASAPSCFQRVMDDVLRNLKWTIALVYLDDVITYGRTLEEHNTRLEVILQALRKANLKLKPSKCHIAQKELKVLGHIVSEEGIKVDPDKVKAVREFSTPNSKTKVRSFLALCNFYRRFIKGIATVAKPLYLLTEKERLFKWDDDCQIAFNKL